MTSPLESLINSGTKLWLDSVDPELVQENFDLGATGATSNPAIISDLIRTGRFDSQLEALAQKGLDDEAIAWELADQLVRSAQEVFLPIWEQTKGNDGYVSFELDPLLEAEDCPLTAEERSAKYIELGSFWAENHKNRMIKIPATPGGIGALEELCAAGVTLNVTLLFTQRQYEAARDAIWRGAQRRASLDGFKSVYSIFVSRVDVYTKQHVPELSEAAQGQVGIVNAQQIFLQNQAFWSDNTTPLQQEMIFASTGTKDPGDAKDKYVSALAGADIQTNPPSTNEAIQQLDGAVYSKSVDQLPAAEVLKDIEQKVDMQKLEDTLMSEGLAKFAKPQQDLIDLIATKRAGISVV
ncbi:MAG: transaldolase family protein [Planctomycetaceae bacterium]